ncbi:MAG: DUF5655 domain-containing protein [Bacteroidota bacterium]
MENKTLFNSGKEVILSYGNDIQMKPCKTYIPFYRNKQFDLLTQTKSGTFKLALNLPDSYLNKHFLPTKKYSARINFETTIHSVEQFSNGVKEALAIAFKHN